MHKQPVDDHAVAQQFAFPGNVGARLSRREISTNVAKKQLKLDTHREDQEGFSEQVKSGKVAEAASARRAAEEFIGDCH